MQDNILLAQEMMLSIRKRVRGFNIILKLDMAKTYDRIKRFALIKIVDAQGLKV